MRSIPYSRSFSRGRRGRSEATNEWGLRVGMHFDIRPTQQEEQHNMNYQILFTILASRLGIYKAI
jgi:excinuclease UvrABC helicase subunit UvrB